MADLGMSMRVRGGRLVVVAERLDTKARKPKFDEADHPRDRLGKFVEVGGTVSIRGGGTGTVLETVGAGRIRVQREDGREVVLDAGLTTQIRSAADNQRAAGNGDALEQALADDPDALPAPGDRPDAEAAAGSDDPTAPRQGVVGGTPAPDADPAGAQTQLRTPDGASAAWLRTDEGQTPVGYLRDDTNDPATTLRFTDGEAWAAEADRRGMVESDQVPPSPQAVPDDSAAPPAGPPAGGPDAPQAPAGQEPAPAIAGGQPADAAPQVTPDNPGAVPRAPDSNTPAAASAPVVPQRTPTTASPDQVRLFIEDGLTGVQQFRDGGGNLNEQNQPTGADLTRHSAAAQQAKVEVAANLTSRMTEVPDEDMLRPTDVDRLARIDAGEVVLMRLPYNVANPQAKPPTFVDPSSPTPGEQLSNWDYREVPRDRFDQLRASGQALPEGLEVVTADQYRDWKRNERVADAVALWAQTSNGLNPQALALQETAADVFGIDDYADWPGFDDYPELREQTATAKADNRTFNEAFLLAQYNATQDRFREQGITEVEMFRGHQVYTDTPEWAAGDTTDALPLRPLSSFSSDESMAGQFARSEQAVEGYIVNATVPVERVIATPRSGVGSLSESEFIVLAGPGTWNVRPADDRDGPLSNNHFDPFGDDLADDDADGEGYVFDAATEPAGFIDSADNLTAAIAAASDPERRQALMRRAQSMGLSNLIPDSWQANGEVETAPIAEVARDDKGRRIIPEAELEAHIAALERSIDLAKAAGLETDKLFTLDGGGEVWEPERARLHNEIVDEVWATAANVPNEGRGLFSGGLGGAGKTTTLGLPQTGIDQSQYLTINPDDVKEIMAAKGMVPDVPDAEIELAPLEKVALIHEESSHIANLIAQRAYAERKNITWDITMASAGSVQKRIAQMQARGYGEMKAVFVDIPIEKSVQRAMGRYTGGLGRFLDGQGAGGRYVPPSIIRANASETFSSANRTNFEGLRDGFDDWQVWDNSVDGRDPRLVYYKGAPDLDRLTEEARSGLTDFDREQQTKTMPGTGAALYRIASRLAPSTHRQTRGTP